MGKPYNVPEVSIPGVNETCTKDCLQPCVERNCVKSDSLKSILLLLYTSRHMSMYSHGNIMKK